MATKETKPTTTATSFTKQQILSAKKYAERRDLLNVLLDDGSYTHDQVEKLIDDFMKKGVK